MFIIFFLLMLSLAFFFKTQILLPFLFLQLIYLVVFNKYYNLISLFFVFLISFSCAAFANDIYFYSFSYDFLGLFNVYTFLAFGLGLFYTYNVFYIMLKFFKINFNSIRIELCLYTIFYISLLLFGEWYFYHIVGVQNLVTSNYDPLGFCNCFHGPVSMFLLYISFGPLYFMLNKTMDAYYKNLR